MYWNAIFLLLLSAVIVNSMLIYRPKQHHRPKLVCYAVPPEAVKGNVIKRMSDSAEEKTTTDNTDSTTEPPRAKRDAEEFDQIDFSNGFDIDIIGASLSDENHEKIRKKLIRTCKALNLHTI